MIESQKKKKMIVVNGYIMQKDKNRNDLYYWDCKHRSHTSAGRNSGICCNGRASTIYIDGVHKLRSSKNHNHAPDTSNQIVIAKVREIKSIASSNQDQPSRIIQVATNQMGTVCRSQMPSNTALTKMIKRAQNRNNPREPNTLVELIVPDDLKFTNNNKLFLLRQSDIGNEKVLLFSTENNLKKLAESNYWIMDGTFKTAPNMFLQIYSIHAPVGGKENSRILPLVYFVMSRKSEEAYKRAFEDLCDSAAEYNIKLAPSFIITDFEKAAINAALAEFPGAINKGCFFHLCQNIWRKIQNSGLATLYGDDENFCLLMRHIGALAFLPSSEIIDAFESVKSILPDNAAEVVSWFDENYVNGRVRRTYRNGREARVPPLFPPEMWSVFQNNNIGFPRTQNKVEGWHRRWQLLVGRNHPGVFHLIKELKKEQEHVEAEMEIILRGEPRPKRKKQYVDRDERFANILNDRHNRSVIDFLRGIAHNLNY